MADGPELGPEISKNRARGGVNAPNTLVLIVSVVLIVAIFAGIYAVWG